MTSSPEQHRPVTMDDVTKRMDNMGVDAGCNFDQFSPEDLMGHLDQIEQTSRYKRSALQKTLEASA